MSTYDTMFDRLMGNEGGYVNDSRDPGGETKWGISKRTYPTLNIVELTREEAKAIYRRDFWDRIAGDQIFDGVAFQLFDFAVNSGIETAVRCYQRALGLADDGHFGPLSIAAAIAVPECRQIMLLCAERLDFMRRLERWKVYGSGWAGRIATDLRYGAMDT